MKKRNDGRVRKEYIRRDLVALLGREEEEDVVRISEEERPFKRLTKRIVRGKKKKRNIFSFWYSRMGAKGGEIEPRRLGGGKKNCNGGTKIC